MAMAIEFNVFDNQNFMAFIILLLNKKLTNYEYGATINTAAKETG